MKVTEEVKRRMHYIADSIYRNTNIEQLQNHGVTFKSKKYVYEEHGGFSIALEAGGYKVAQPLRLVKIKVICNFIDLLDVETVDCFGKTRKQRNVNIGALLPTISNMARAAYFN